MRAVIVGSGAVGSRVARQLISLPGRNSVLMVDPDRARGAAVAEALGPGAAAGPWSARAVSASEVVVLASPGHQHPLAEQALDLGVHVVSVADDDQAARALLRLDGTASRQGRHLVVGAGFSPGLSCVLARHAANDLERVDEIRVARWGSGGPACARGRQRALASALPTWWPLGPFLGSLSGTVVAGTGLP
jgi:saccharopine dehydrogenase-like NADP-dependent oxidoreductase